MEYKGIMVDATTQFLFAASATFAACALAWRRWVEPRAAFQASPRSVTALWAEANLRLPRTFTFNPSVGRHRA